MKKSILAIAISLGGLFTVNAQNIIQDDQNTTGRTDNNLQFKIGGATTYNTRGFTLGDYSQGDYSLNLFYRGTQNGSSGRFNIKMYKWGGTYDVFSANEHGDIEIGNKLHIGGSELSLGTGLGKQNNTMAMIRSKANGDRWLLFNPNKHFEAGVWFGSRVLIDENASWWSQDNVKLPNDARLAVRGKIYAEEIVCQLQGNWPDYVFKNDYKLMSLSDTKAFINKNGHLPGLASASTIETEGINTGATIRLQMEKIEELTLHLIRIEEEKKALELRLSKIEATLVK